MTLDDFPLSLLFVKGHFCSVLLSNIIGYLRFCRLNNSLTGSGFHCFLSFSDFPRFRMFSFAVTFWIFRFCFFSFFETDGCVFSALWHPYQLSVPYLNFCCFLGSYFVFAFEWFVSVLQLLFWSFWDCPVLALVMSLWQFLLSCASSFPVCFSIPSHHLQSIMPFTGRPVYGRILPFGSWFPYCDFLLHVLDNFSCFSLFFTG